MCTSAHESGATYGTTSLGHHRRGDWRGDSVELLDLPPAPPTHGGLVQDFVDAVRSGRAVGVPGSAGMVTSAVLEAAYLAAKTSQTVLLA